MRSFISAATVLMAVGLGLLAGSALGANTAPPVVEATGVNAGTQVDVHSNSMTGATFTAPETGAYQFTIVSGAYSYMTPKAGTTSPYSGWLTEIQLYTAEVTWGAADEWGKHPLNAAAMVGSNKHLATSAAAEAAGKGAAVTLNLQKGAKVTLLVSDGSKYYGDNKGVVKVRITAGTAPATSTPPVTPEAPGSIMLIEPGKP